MRRLYTRIKSNLEIDILELRESNYDFLRFHVGTNSVSLPLLLSICIAISFDADVLNWKYLKGLNDDLTFFIGLFSIIFGVGFYNFWRFGEKSLYTFHFVKTKFMPGGVNVIFMYKDFSFGISSQIKTQCSEFSPLTRQLLCIGIFLNLALITLDNGGFDGLKRFPSEIFESKSSYCPSKEEGIEIATPKEGCELIIRAYKLGYAKDLGICEPEKIDPDKMKVCEKRRDEEPYLHYMTRLFSSSIERKVAFFKNNKLAKVVAGFDSQLQKLEVLTDFRVYAISAAPRASHHIWTNLPYPENAFVQKYREFMKPSYCIEQFQNQTNTVKLEEEDDNGRNSSKLLEHVYGQLLFNPKSRISVGFCKEYKIHWNSKTDLCERLSQDPEAVLLEENVLSEVELVLRRHDIANVILRLDEEIQEIENIEINPDNAKEDEHKAIKQNVIKAERKLDKKTKNTITKDKIAQRIRKKNELVSFQCLMLGNELSSKNAERNVHLKGTDFLVRTRYSPRVEGKGESQIAMYKDFSRLLEQRFHYSQLTSRSDIKLEGVTNNTSNDAGLLEEPTYLFSRLEMLKNVDIFLGNNWVMERDDLLGVYPYHVHLQNYVDSFRVEYQESRGRL